MTEHRHTAPDAIAAATAGMEHCDRAWQAELADSRTTHGETDQRRHRAHEHAKDDRARPVLNALPDWIAALEAATAPETAPEPAP